MKKKALVVDDVQINRNLLRSYLCLFGFDVDMACDGIEALKFLSGFDYDLIFSDIEMPNMNGLELLKRIKLNKKYKNIPFIMISSVKDDEIIQKSKILGSNFHISKPFNRESMSKALEYAGV